MKKSDFNDRIEELDWIFDGKKLVKELDFDSFSESLDFLSEVASIVEDMGVHPKVHITPDGVKLILPASGQLNEEHIALAEEIDNL